MPAVDFIARHMTRRFWNGTGDMAQCVRTSTPAAGRTLALALYRTRFDALSEAEAYMGLASSASESTLGLDCGTSASGTAGHGAPAVHAPQRCTEVRPA